MSVLLCTSCCVLFACSTQCVVYICCSSYCYALRCLTVSCHWRTLNCSIHSSVLSTTVEVCSLLQSYLC